MTIRYCDFCGDVIPEGTGDPVTLADPECVPDAAKDSCDPCGNMLWGFTKEKSLRTGDLALLSWLKRVAPETFQAWSHSFELAKPSLAGDPPGPRLATYADGSWVELLSYAGGAHPKGAWSELRLLMHATDGTEKTVLYHAQPPASAALGGDGLAERPCSNTGTTSTVQQPPAASQEGAL